MKATLIVFVWCVVFLALVVAPALRAESQPATTTAPYIEYTTRRLVPCEAWGVCVAWDDGSAQPLNAMGSGCWDLRGVATFGREQWGMWARELGAECGGE